MHYKKIVGVIGANSAGDDILKQAESVGRLIGENNFSLVTGGKTGVMEAASRGAKQAGALTIGILPDEEKSEANPFVDIAVPTGFGIGRNIIIARMADVLIAVGGQYGTLSEIAFGLQMKKPVISLNSWEIKGVIMAESPEEAVTIAAGFLC